MIRVESIIVADSGSTKTNWCLSGEGNSMDQFSTEGINPFFRSTQNIVAEWKMSPLALLSDQVASIYFYGAGITDKGKAGILEKAFVKFFSRAKIEVNSDLLAAARATLGETAGIASILGTGSNSCLYNGKEISMHVPPLGYILGDEGSGAFMGRRLVGDYLKEIMPESLRLKFHDQFPIPYPEMLHRVYQGDNPNRFLAGFVPFIKEYISHRYCIDLVENAFNQFVERNIFRYPGYREVPLSFVGSIAYHFQEQLKNVLLRHGLVTGVILPNPLMELMKYHMRRRA